MTDSEILTLVSYAIGAFGIGYATGFLMVTFRKLLDQI